VDIDENNLLPIDYYTSEDTALPCPYVWKRTKISLTNKQTWQERVFKKADLEMLEWAASVG